MVTPELVADYNKYVNENYSFEDVDKVELTEQDLIQAWDRYWDEDSVLNTKVTAHGDHVYDFSYTLGDTVRDILSDEMWDQDCDQGDTHTEEVDDYVYAVPTNDEN